MIEGFVNTNLEAVVPISLRGPEGQARKAREDVQAYRSSWGILNDELDEMGAAPTLFASQINVSPEIVSQVIAGKRSVTGDLALRFGHWFQVEPQFWLNLQSQFDLAAADQRAGAAIRRLPTAAGSSASAEP